MVVVSLRKHGHLPVIVVGGGPLFSWDATQNFPIKLTCAITKGIHMTREHYCGTCSIADILYSNESCA